MGPSLDSVFMVMEYADHDLKAGGLSGWVGGLAGWVLVGEHTIDAIWPAGSLDKQTMQRAAHTLSLCNAAEEAANCLPDALTSTVCNGAVMEERMTQPFSIAEVKTLMQQLLR